MGWAIRLFNLSWFFHHLFWPPLRQVPWVAMSSGSVWASRRTTRPTAHAYSESRDGIRPGGQPAYFKGLFIPVQNPSVTGGDFG